jgi:hypothetical protein
VGGGQGRDNIEVLRVEDVACDERDRVLLLRRSEQFMSEVREFCKLQKQVSNQADQPKRKTIDHLGVNPL